MSRLSIAITAGFAAATAAAQNEAINIDTNSDCFLLTQAQCEVIERYKAALAPLDADEQRQLELLRQALLVIQVNCVYDELTMRTRCEYK